MVDGDARMGKSLVLIDLIVRLSRGDGMMNGAPSVAYPIHSCYFDKEEGEQTLKARLRAAGADLNYIHAPNLKGVAYTLPAA
jgi:hypothetical protein